MPVFKHCCFKWCAQAVICFYFFATSAVAGIADIVADLITNPNDAKKFEKTIKSMCKKTFLESIGSLQVLYNEDVLACKNAWVNQRTGTTMMYAQKLFVPVGTSVCFVGDIHGYCYSLIRVLAKLVKEGYIQPNLIIPNKSFYMIFLGDYIDRGDEGEYTLKILGAFKEMNSGTVFLLRGNHEHQDMFQHPHSPFVTLYSELMKKNKRGLPNYTQQNIDSICMWLGNLFYKLPAVIYLGTTNGDGSLVQCCHGGIEIGYDPTVLLGSPSKTYEWIPRKNAESVYLEPWIIDFLNPYQNIIPYSKLKLEKLLREAWENVPLNNATGLLWSDFRYGKTDFEANYARRAGYLVSASAANKFMNIFNDHLEKKKSPLSLKGFFRGHQHGQVPFKTIDPKKDFFEIDDFYSPNVDFSVTQKITFNVSSFEPAIFTFSTAGDLVACDGCGILTVAKNYSDWKLDVHYIKSFGVCEKQDKNDNEKKVVQRRKVQLTQRCLSIEPLIN